MVASAGVVRGQLEEAGQDGDAEDADADADDRGQQRQAGGDQRAEGDDQDDEGHQDPDALGGARGGGLLGEGVAAHGDGQAGVLEGRDGVVHRVLVGRGELDGRAVVAHDGVRRAAVRRDRPGRERVGDRGDVLGGELSRAVATTSWLAGEVTCSPSGACTTTRAIAPSVAACGVRSLIRSKAWLDSVEGELEGVVRLAGQRGGADATEHQEGEPARDHAAAVPEAPTAQLVELPRHRPAPSIGDRLSGGRTVNPK